MSRITVERSISFDSQRRVYYVCLDAGRDTDGRRRRRWRTAPTLKQARGILQDFQSQKRRGLPPSPPPLTLGEWLERWLEEIIRPTRAATTLYGYRKMIQNHLVPALGAVPLPRLSPGDVQAYYLHLLRDKALSPNTVRRHHDLLSAALRAAVRQGLLSSNPMERVEPPRPLPAEIPFYSAEQLRRLLELTRNTPLELPVHLAGTLGLRREELCGLLWSEVDLERRLLHVCRVRTCAGGQVVEKEPKNRSSVRSLHLSADLAHLLAKEKRTQEARRQALGEHWPDTGLVVVNDLGIPPSPNALSRSFTRFVQRHSLPRLTLHGLRHSFATVANQQGASLFEIGKALGHSTPATTGKIYTHLTDRTHAAVLDRVAAALR